MTAWLVLLVAFVLVLGIADAVCSIIERRYTDDDTWRVPPPNHRSRRSGRESW